MKKSIALWSHPRSLSTAFERMFMEYDDYKIFHEPFSYVFYIHEERLSIPHKNPDKNHPVTYAEIRDTMEQARQNQAIFHKDFPYHVLDHLLADPDYLRKQTNTFLIRNPKDTVLSHANIHPHVTREALGYEALVRLFDAIREITGQIPALVDADDLIENPYEVVSAYCNKARIAFKPSALQWKSGDKKEWSTWKGWHNEVAESSGFHKPREIYKYHFADLPHLKDYVECCQPFYDYLSQFKLTVKKENVA